MISGRKPELRESGKVVAISRAEMVEMISLTLKYPACGGKKRDAHKSRSILEGERREKSRDARAFVKRGLREARGLVRLRTCPNISPGMPKLTWSVGWLVLSFSDGEEK